MPWHQMFSHDPWRFHEPVTQEQEQRDAYQKHTTKQERREYEKRYEEF
jgi:hypothetical protein